MSLQERLRRKRRGSLGTHGPLNFYVKLPMK